MYRAGFFLPPHPYTVLAAVRSALEFVDARIALVNLTAQDFDAVTSTSSGGDVARAVLEALGAFNQTNSPERLVLDSAFERDFIEYFDELRSSQGLDTRLAAQITVEALEGMA
jgi:hypothetical protein